MHDIQFCFLEYAEPKPQVNVFGLYYASLLANTYSLKAYGDVVAGSAYNKRINKKKQTTEVVCFE